MHDRMQLHRWSLVVGVVIIGNLAGYPFLDPIAALVFGFMISKMGWEFGWKTLHDPMDRSLDEEELPALKDDVVGNGWRRWHL
jgi:divalent metal cation (Fe/Co/Zn/Cd) transporter